MGKLNWRDFVFSKKTGEVLVKVPGQIAGQGFMVEELTDCVVFLLDHSAQVTIDCCKNTKFFIGPCEDSVFIRNCSNCTFTVACRQLRTRECENCDLSLYVATDPIVELSTNTIFRPFNGSYEGLDAHFQAARMDPAQNKYNLVYDFNKDDTSIPMPHWLLADPMPVWAVDIQNPIASLSASQGTETIDTIPTPTTPSDASPLTTTTAELADTLPEECEPSTQAVGSLSDWEVVNPSEVAEAEPFFMNPTNIQPDEQMHPLVKWREEFDARVSEIHAKETEKAQITKQLALADLKKKVEERKKMIEARKKSNREAEATFIAASKITGKSVWDVMCQYVDLHENKRATDKDRDRADKAAMRGAILAARHAPPRVNLSR
eukprot:TRINITY_DN8851_c0_g1::TRINITY_DN8851_c0_g1_i1::g.19018::m.19018 TRINITY_DN8851_c0_g1::TRINITY_DN8851_c0_g1_i1::g.19018  ORF type:complete len:377 (+),score=61.27,sp/Q9EPK2/XRP2_MOUSE/40.28/5e-31,TBCC/PF07986.7/9.1e-38,Clathrin_lg_ch/PF01086.12/3.7e-10 TRINITY_DN8851_c0_g1_i1:72-1202(+)